MELKKVFVTPLLAAELLQSNLSNRPLKKGVLDNYVKQLKLGLWKEDTGECIKISKSNVLLDGQHRLQAIVKSDVSVYLHILYGLEDSIFDVLDTGSKRNASDVLSINGVGSSKQKAAILQAYIELKNNLFSHGNQLSSRLTNSELTKMYLDDSKKWEYIHAESIKWYFDFSKIITLSTIGSYCAIFMESEKYSDKFHEFFDQLCGHSPQFETIILLKKILTDDRINSQRKISNRIKNALIIKAWNSFVTNKPLALLKFDSVREGFPKIL